MNPDAAGYWNWQGPFSSQQAALNSQNRDLYDNKTAFILPLPSPYPYFGNSPKIKYKELQIYKLPHWPNAKYFSLMKINDPQSGSDYWFCSPRRDWYSFKSTVDLTPTAKYPNGNFWFEEEWDPEFSKTGIPSGTVVGLYELLQLSFANPELLGGKLGKIVTGTENIPEGDWATEGWKLRNSHKFAFAEETYNLYQYYDEKGDKNRWKISINGEDFWEGKDGETYFNNLIKDASKSFEDDVANFLNPINLYKKVSQNKLREFRLQGNGILAGETPWYLLKIIEVNLEDTSKSKVLKSTHISVNSFNDSENYWDFSFATLPDNIENEWREAVDILCAEYDEKTYVKPEAIDGIGTRPEMGFFPILIRSLNGIVKTFFSMTKGFLIALPILTLIMSTYIMVIYGLNLGKQVVANGS